ncbi:hypothetical protein LXA43DRAFT_1025925 [Ganoderma leucocontextum]|nr:hypothetical protein LXA43DRAFT_1025925 [Ganoderma leucocontextum]
MTPHTRQAHVLLCPDILMEILNHLQPGRCDTPQDKKITIKRFACRRALLASALTCRTLSDLALAVLWRALDDIRPLLRLLPSYKQHRPTIVLKSEIARETWTKFRSYATRVREIRHSPPYAVHPSVWTFLALKCEGSPLLPRLYHLDAHDISPDDLSPLFLLLSPSLRSLSLSFGQKSRSDVAAPEVVLLAVQHIAQVAPRVESFHISGHHRFTRKHLSTLQKFAGLTELSLGPNFLLDRNMLRQLSTTTSLDALTITIGHMNSSSLESLSDNFQSLYRLTLRGDLDDLVTFILAFRLPRLGAFTIQVNDCDGPKTFGPRFASICQHPGIPKSLTRVGCEFCSGMIVQRQETLMQYLEPLLSFPKVEHCNLIFHNTAPSVCDEDLIQLGDAWPNLQYLNVTEFTTSSERYGRYSKYGHLWCNTPDIQHPTVLGLTELARRCPMLRYLHLVTADASALPQVDAVSRLDHPIQEMLFDHVHNAASSSEKRCAVAEVLDVAFPKLSISLSAGCRLLRGRPESRHQWRRILMLVRVMRRRRKHPTSDSGDSAAMQSLADLDVDGEVTDSDRGWSPDNFKDKAMDSDSASEDSEDSEDSHDSNAESDSQESDDSGEVRDSQESDDSDEVDADM